jgi:methylenetetrahydrofolate dehydrogenase (NADP+)/methenyltetrahydrofolate cyclohydrolase
MKNEIQCLRQRHSKTPLLASIQIGENAASGVYIKSQARIAEDMGIDYRLLSLPQDVSKKDLACEIAKLNTDLGVHGIIVQAPLPRGLNMHEVIALVDANKDAEGLHPRNLGKIVLGQAKIAPCTAQACMELLRYYKIKLYGKEVVIVGHSEIVGKPLSLMLLNEFATTTVCHIATSEANKLVGHIERADILIVAVGKAHLIKGSWIKKGAVVIDVGINKIADRIVGDVEFEAAEKRASYITPVPGGVGPMTVTMLMKNMLELFGEFLSVR